MMGILSGLRRWQSVSAVLSLAGLLDSTYLFSYKLGHPLICATGGCDAVNSSPYSEILGIPVAVIGMLGYAALLALAVWAFAAADRAPYWLTDLRLFCAVIGILFAAYLTGIELFVLHAICTWCVVSATIITTTLIALVLERRAENAPEPVTE